MLYAIGQCSLLRQVAGKIDASLGFPKFGVSSLSGEAIVPAPGQDPKEVPGVTLHYAEVMAKHDDANLGAYPFDEVTAPFLNAHGLTAQELPADWFPPEESGEEP